MALNLFKRWKKNEPKAPQARKDLDMPKVSEEQVVPSIAAPISSVLRSFRVSEKANQGIALNQYTFIVDPHATKSQVRDAVQRSYHVHVTHVCMVHLPGKKRFLGRHHGAIVAKKKAIVSLKDGDSIAAAQP